MPFPARPWDVRTSTDLRRVALGLRMMDDRAVTGEFRRELRAAARPLVPAVRSSALSIPSAQGRARRRGASHDGRSLRAAIARAVTLKVRTSYKTAMVRLLVDGRKMPGREGKLPQYMEGTARPWRHPVFGNTNVWVTQPPHPYFYRVVNRLGPASRIAVNRAIDHITRRIT
jgi:hypothetical protein